MKNTKATELLSIDQLFKSWDQVQSIESPSAELKNGCANLGALNEARVARYLAKKCNFKILQQNFRSSGVELDILAQLNPVPSFLFVFEVKTLKNFNYLDLRIRMTQKKRLRQAGEALATKHHCRLELVYTFIGEHQILFRRDEG